MLLSTEEFKLKQQYEQYYKTQLPDDVLVVDTKGRGWASHFAVITDPHEIFMWRVMNRDD